MERAEATPAVREPLQVRDPGDRDRSTIAYTVELIEVSDRFEHRKPSYCFRDHFGCPTTTLVQLSRRARRLRLHTGKAHKLVKCDRGIRMIDERRR
jgi:hypothetical protein